MSHFPIINTITPISCYNSCIFSKHHQFTNHPSISHIPPPILQTHQTPLTSPLGYSVSEGTACTSINPPAIVSNIRGQSGKHNSTTHSLLAVAAYYDFTTLEHTLHLPPETLCLSLYLLEKSMLCLVGQKEPRASDATPPTDFSVRIIDLEKPRQMVQKRRLDCVGGG